MWLMRSHTLYMQNISTMLHCYFLCIWHTPMFILVQCSSYSIMWPIKSCHKGDECTRDFLSGIGEDKHRSARLTAWFHTPENYFIHVHPLCPSLACCYRLLGRFLFIKRVFPVVDSVGVWEIPTKSACESFQVSTFDTYNFPKHSP